jgi:hypothetical protein
MKFSVVSLVILSALPVTFSQLSFDSTSSTYSSNIDGTYCARPSLSSSILVTCESGICTPCSCSDKLNVPYSACYQSSPTAGNAACAVNGTAYPDNAPPYRHPVSPTSSLGPIASPTLPPQVLQHFNGTQCGCENGTHPHAPGGPGSGWKPSGGSGGGAPSSSSPGPKSTWVPGGGYAAPTSLYIIPPRPTGGASMGLPSTQSSSMKTLASTWKPKPTASSVPKQSAGVRTGSVSCAMLVAFIIATLTIA